MLRNRNGDPLDSPWPLVAIDHTSQLNLFKKYTKQKSPPDARVRIERAVPVRVRI